METISLNLTAEQINHLKNIFKDDLLNKRLPHVLFQIKTENCTITAYESLKVVFQGKDAQIYASSYQSTTFIDQAGSDEVGTGDYFGPITVCACIVEKKDLAFLNTLNIQDSKTISDENILKTGHLLMKKLKYSLLILDNKKYNEIHQSNNMNQIKAKLHNQAYLNLKKKYSLPALRIIDQFTPENLYYNYIKNEKETVDKITFTTKAESKYLSVAAASIIARYAFLKKWAEMEKEYDFEFIKGASDAVDRNIAEFVRKFGYEKLKHVAKIHFKNTEKYVAYL